MAYNPYYQDKGPAQQLNYGTGTGYPPVNPGYQYSAAPEAPPAYNEQQQPQGYDSITPMEYQRQPAYAPTTEPMIHHQPVVIHQPQPVPMQPARPNVVFINNTTETPGCCYSFCRCICNCIWNIILFIVLVIAVVIVITYLNRYVN